MARRAIVRTMQNDSTLVQFQQDYMDLGRARKSVTLEPGHIVSDEEILSLLPHQPRCQELMKAYFVNFGYTYSIILQPTF